ncbi:MAG TPA: wax ester/triacylglycerol synthase family O-acyltransferase [Ilumatobacteraceae bacterium]|nr:wax ester/triacylglycerol synthase family O-acyltransferase [Ilumatobacteraceae bacterium]
MTETYHERLSSQDLSFLAMEDGRAHMHVGVVSLFDAGPLRLPNGGIDFEQIESFVDAQLHLVPRLRQKLAWVKGFGQPVWVDDANFNLHYHLRHTALPPPGDIRQLKRLAGRIMSQELDRGKPLWEHWFVDGVEGGCFALISKVHHCVADGIGGLAIIGTLAGPDPDYRPDPPTRWVPRPSPGDAQLIVDEVRHRSIAPIEFLGSQLRRSRSASAGALPSVSALRELAETSVGGTTTPLNAPIGPHRRFDWIRLSFDEVHDVAVRAGGKVNDVALALTTGALRGFLADEGLAVDDLELRAMVPVSTRTESETGSLGNRVSNLIVPLPIGEADPWVRLERIIEVTRELKRSNEPSIVDAMSSLIEFVPPPLLGPVLRRGSQGTAANLAVSNIPGPRVPLYLLGARQLDMYPVLPLIGNQSLGIALMSYDDSLCWGFNSDWDAMPDLHDLVDRVAAGHAELLELATDA